MPTISRRSRLLTKPVRLAAEGAGSTNVVDSITTETGGHPRWVQVGAAGTYKGHHTGEFTLDAQVFGELVENLRAHPSYEAGSSNRVLAYDFSHASESHPSTIANEGAPAQGWVLDLEVRGDQIWALTEWLEPVATDIAEGRYAWTSMAIWPDAKNPVSGETVGWVMSSIAITNDPFIQGMVPIAASRAKHLSRDPVGSIRDLFGLPATAGIPELRIELAKLRGFLSVPATAPPGVELEFILSEMRWLLSLPILATTGEVLDEVEKLFAMEPVPPVPVVQPGAIVPPSPAPQAIANKQERGIDMTLLKQLAGRLNLPANEEEITAAVLVQLEAGETAKGQLEQLFAMLGIKDGASAKAKAKMQELMDMKDLMPTIEGLLAGALEVEGADADEDVDAVVAAYRVDPAMRPSLLKHRNGGVQDVPALVEGETMGTRLSRYETAIKGRQAAKESFRKDYPQAFATPTEQTLLSSIATPRPRSVLDRVNVSGGGLRFNRAPAQAPAVGAPPPGTPDEDAKTIAGINLAAGRNPIEKAQNWLLSQPGGDKLSREEVNQKASMLMRRLRSA